MVENVIQIKSGIMISVNGNAKNIIFVKKIWNPPTCSFENGKYLASIIDDSVIMWDEIIDAEEKNYSNKFQKKQPVKHKVSIIDLHFY